MVRAGLALNDERMTKSQWRRHRVLGYIRRPSPQRSQT